MPRDIYFHIEVDDHQAKEFFVYAGYHIRDARDPFRRVAYEVILPGLVEQFDTEGERTGGWEPLDDDYLEDKIKAGYGNKPILERTGAMKRDLLDPLAFHVTKDHLSYNPSDFNQVAEYGNRYDFYHQTGEGRVPARPWLVLTPNDERQIAEIFYEWLDELRLANRRRPNTGVYLGPLPEGYTLI